MIIDEEVYLAHHGVKGMRWGVRRERIGKRVGTARKNFNRRQMQKVRARSGMSAADKRRRAIVSGVAGTAALAIGVATILDASRGTRYHDIPHFNAGGTSFKFKTRAPSGPTGPPLRVQNLNDFHGLGGSAHHPQLAARRVLELNAGTPISSFSGFSNQVNHHLNRPYLPGQLLHPTSQDRMNEWLRR